MFVIFSFTNYFSVCCTYIVQYHVLIEINQEDMFLQDSELRHGQCMEANLRHHKRLEDW